MARKAKKTEILLAIPKQKMQLMREKGGTFVKANVRAAVAAIIKAQVSGRNTSTVYSYAESTHWQIQVSISGSSVQGFDYTSSCHVGGNLPNLYHYGGSSHLTLNDRGNGRFDGYDYETSSHFSATVSGQSISIYDHEHSAHFSYQ